MSKKAQASGGRAAALIAIIAVIIVIYIAMLPTEERHELLYGENFSEKSDKTGVSEENLLVLTHPGRLDYFEQNKIEHSIPNMHLYTKTEGVIFKKLDSIFVSKWLFGSKSKEINFTIGDLENTKNVILGYSVKKGTGRLIMSLNGEEILNKEVSTAQPLTLPQEYLKKGDNVLKISSSRSNIFGSDSYTLNNLIITGDVKDVSGQTASAVFLVSASEKNHLDYVRLKFVPHCNLSSVGKLDIIINGNYIFSAKPDYCNSPLPAIEFSPSHIYSDENTLVFTTNEGNYVLDQIKVESRLKEYTQPTFYFNLKKDQYEDIKKDGVDVMLKLKFSDNIAYKAAKIIVNSKSLYIDGKDQTYEWNIQDHIIAGNNQISIEPSITMNIVDLIVELE